DPHASANVTVTKGVAYDEPFDRLQASIDYNAKAIQVTQMQVIAGAAQITGSLAFEPQRADWRDGLARFQLSSNDLNIEQFETMKSARPDLKGMARANVAGAATLHDGGVLLTSVNGDLTAHDLTLEDRQLGNLKVTAATQDSLLTVQLDSNYLNSV